MRLRRKGQGEVMISAWERLGAPAFYGGTVLAIDSDLQHWVPWPLVGHAGKRLLVDLSPDDRLGYPDSLRESRCIAPGERSEPGETESFSCLPLSPEGANRYCQQLAPFGDRPVDDTPSPRGSFQSHAYPALFEGGGTELPAVCRSS